MRYLGSSGGTATRSCLSTVSRSALPLPCAIHVPEHARITGSSAVTRPLAGRCTRMPCGVFTWMYGSRFDTTMMSSPRISPRSTARSVSCVQRCCDSSVGRNWCSSSRSSACTSRAIGRSSGAVSADGRRMPSPRRSARRPATQPRHDSWAMTTVISATHADSAAKK